MAEPPPSRPTRLGHLLGRPKVRSGGKPAKAAPKGGKTANAKASGKTSGKVGGQAVSRPRRPAPPGSRERILEAAKERFATHGVAATSVADIARAAKVSKANVFHHFGSKEGLHLEIVRSLTDRGSALFEMLGAADVNAAERLRGFSTAHLAAILEDPVGTRMMLGELLSSSPQHIRYLAEEFFERDFQILVDMIAEAQRGGAWRDDLDPAAIALVLLSAQVFFFQAQPILRHFRSVDFADRPEVYSRNLIELLLNGLVPRGNGEATPSSTRTADR